MKRLLAIGLLAALQAGAEEPVMLLTGFEPFGGAKVNTSWEVVKHFQGKTAAGHRIETVQLPVVYDAIETPLTQAIQKFKPAVVVCFGEGTATIQIETVARNGYHSARPPDNKGLPPPREKILPDGKDEIPTGLPLQRLTQNLHHAGIRYVVSKDAGGYLCNECFYRLMALPQAPAVRGFIHLPVVRDNPEAISKLQKNIEFLLNMGLITK